jgi:hypothetical protein
MKYLIEKVTMGQLRKAEGSNSAAMELLAAHAVDAAGEPIPPEQALEVLDGMTMLEFYAEWAEFNKAALPNMSGRRS